VSGAATTAVVAWLITAVYYFYQYTLRSAPAVMMPQLSEAFGISATAVASMVGLFYYGYSPFSLVAGTALDRLGPRRVVPIGAAAVGIGALMFASGNGNLASIGRFLQGAGGVFALVGAVYIATTNFPRRARRPSSAPRRCSAWPAVRLGNSSSARSSRQGTPWNGFWTVMGVAGLVIAALAAVPVAVTHGERGRRRRQTVGGPRVGDRLQ
jgi:MFS family permease